MLNITDEVTKQLASYSGSTDFSDEINEMSIYWPEYDNKIKVENNVITAMQEGSAYVSVSLSNNRSISLNIAVSDIDIQGISFRNNDYYYALSSYPNTMINELQTIPEYMSNVVEESDVTWTSSNHDVAIFSSEQPDFYYGNASQLNYVNEGETTITAKYGDYETFAIVHILSGSNEFYIRDESGMHSSSSNVSIQNGEKIELQYVLGDNNSVTDAKISTGNDCVKLIEENGNYYVEAITSGYANIVLTDKFHNQIQFNISIYEMPESITIGDVSVFKIRKEEFNQKNYSIFPQISPSSAYSAKVKWEIENNDGVITQVAGFNSNAFVFKALKPGKFTLKVTTENGKTDEKEIEITEGNYISSFDYKKTLQYQIDVGKTLDVRQIVMDTALPQGADFSDESLKYRVLSGDDFIDLSKEGILTAKQEGAVYLSVISANGSIQYVNICIGGKLSGLSFSDDLYTFKSSNITAWFELKTNPQFVAVGIDLNDIEITSSDPSILSITYKSVTNQSNKSSIGITGMIYREGDITLTAKYGGYSCSTKVHIYTPKEQTVLNVEDNQLGYVGYRSLIHYAFGEEEDQSCSIQILDGEDNIALTSSSADDGVFEVIGKHTGSAKLRVSSPMNEKLYKDITVQIKDNVTPQCTITVETNNGVIQPDDDGGYTLTYGKMYNFFFSSNIMSNTQETYWSKLHTTGLFGSVGGGDGGYDENGYGEQIGDVAGKIGEGLVEIYPGYSIKIRVVPKFEQISTGEVNVVANSLESLNIDEAQIRESQEKLNSAISQQVSKKEINSTVTEISSQSEKIVQMDEVANVTLNTHTVVSLTEDKKALIYDITPSMVLSAEKKYANTSTTLGEKNIEVKKSITLDLPVGNYVDESKPVYIRHIKEDGTEYVYSGTYDKENGTVKFENPNGFSKFEITQEPLKVTKEEAKSNENSSAKKKRSTNTSDSSNVLMYASLLIIAFLGAITIVKKRKA